MKKRIGAVLLGLSLIPINCFGAVNVLNDEYKTSVSTVTVRYSHLTPKHSDFTINSSNSVNI